MFTFGLADNMRWMPNEAREMFEAELDLINMEGQQLIKDLLKGDVDKYIESKRSTLVKDIKDMLKALGRPRDPSESEIERVVTSLKKRLSKAQTANFAPKLSYSKLNFERTDSKLVSPWGQAFSLLADVAALPRKAKTEGFFFTDFNVDEDKLLEVMNVADDALLHEQSVKGLKKRCKAELGLLARIKKADMDAKERCGLVRQILRGDPIGEIEEKLQASESE